MATTALRPWRESDVPKLVAMCQDEEITRWTRVPTAYGITSARAWIAESRALVSDGISAPFAIVAAAGRGAARLDLADALHLGARARRGRATCSRARLAATATRPAPATDLRVGLRRARAGADRPPTRRPETPPRNGSPSEPGSRARPSCAPTTCCSERRSTWSRSDCCRGSSTRRDAYLDGRTYFLDFAAGVT
jgi:hypothetical protein